MDHCNELMKKIEVELKDWIGEDKYEEALVHVGIMLCKQQPITEVVHEHVLTFVIDALRAR